MTDGLRFRVNRPSKKYSKLGLTARKSPLVYASASCVKYRYKTQPCYTNLMNVFSVFGL